MEYKTKRVKLRNGHIIEAPYPLYGALVARNKAILVLEDNDAEDTA